MEKTKINEQIQFNLALANAAYQYDEATVSQQKKLRPQYQAKYQFNNYLEPITHTHQQVNNLISLSRYGVPIILIGMIFVPQISNLKLILMFSLVFLLLGINRYYYTLNHQNTWNQVMVTIKQIKKETYIKYFINAQKDWLNHRKQYQKLKTITIDQQSSDDVYKLGKLKSDIDANYEQLATIKTNIERIYGEDVLENYVVINALKKNPVEPID